MRRRAQRGGTLREPLARGRGTRAAIIQGSCGAGALPGGAGAAPRPV